MKPILLNRLIRWIINEYHRYNSIFDVPLSKFYRTSAKNGINLFNHYLELPIGPAAGPHTQLSQNIISSYLVGGRFFELKTVQMLDELEIPRPCIDAEDEGYNVEWSQELKLEHSLSEYINAWILIHLIKKLLNLATSSESGIIFNMSVGYNLEGIMSSRMDNFINNLIDARLNGIWEEKIEITKREILNNENSRIIKDILSQSRINSSQVFDELIQSIETISPHISNSVTLSTMHGCPADEIEAIAKYLISEKKLNTYIKLNPTLLGFEKVSSILKTLGYDYIELDGNSFEHDLTYESAIPMIKNLQVYAVENEVQFGVKLSNTLGVLNYKDKLSGEQMYLSGRALFPITINLASKLASDLNGKIQISFSGGINSQNVAEVLSTGIYPITLVTDLLKPGGYYRLYEIAREIEKIKSSPIQRIDIERLQNLANNSLNNGIYHKDSRDTSSLKLSTKLSRFDCYVAPCQVACPIHQDVPEYINLIREKRYEEAFEIIVDKNPLPNITGYICDHQCMTKCVRWDYDQTLEIRELKKVAAENGYEKYFQKIKEAQKLDIKVAIIGAGPAGLSASYFLSKQGFDVTVFEKRNLAGGIVQHVIPKFRLPESAIQKDIDLIVKNGVQFKFNSSENFSIEELKKNGFKYIFIAIGAEKSNPLKFKSGGSLIYDAIDFLLKFRRDERIHLGTVVAVIGGGNSAMDSARAALRIAGVEKVFIIYRRTKKFMPADKEEFDSAIHEGAILKELLLPVEFSNNELKCQKMKLGEIGPDGRREVVPIENKYEIIRVDSVISAIGERVNKDILQLNNILFDKDNKPKINYETNETSVENVFIGGDAYRGPATVVEAIADGRKVAEAIIKKEFLNNKLNPNTSFLNILNNGFERVGEIKGKNIPQIEIDDDLESASQEASRCLNCNVICNKCVEVCPNRANVSIISPFVQTNDNFKFKNKFQIVHIKSMCNECGNCETFCPHNGAPFKDKVTLFESIESLNKFSNDGFVKDNKLSNRNFIVRVNGQIGSVELNDNGDLIRTSISDWEKNSDFKKFISLIFTICNQYEYLLPTEESFKNVVK